ncbi:TIGR04197 family type VII secretion effector [Listeria aquatica]|uniref:TIGR04197 family type VII secretion effector n=1 Tax=Listeria aquatica TaxID=1494960 RepID=UPI0031F55A34
MSEIKSSQTEAKQLAEKLRTACDELQQTRQLMAVGTFSTVTPAKEMQSAFSNSLRYTDEYTKNLQDSIEKILTAAECFSEQDKVVASEIQQLK